jgi:glutamate-ammonia-ligase adenylyltransferase
MAMLPRIRIAALSTPTTRPRPALTIEAAIDYAACTRQLRDAAPDRLDALCRSLDRPWHADAALLDDLRTSADPASLAAALRRLREEAMARTALRDLTGRASLTEVCAAMTALAETAIEHALDAHARWMAEAHGVPRSDDGQPVVLHVVAMGKLGGGELNVSSDIDVVFAFTREGHSDGDRPLANQEYFDRLSRRLVSALDERTAEGFVFRVDTRLRPYGSAGPPTSSFAALEEYLITQGRTWERYAWLKARVLGGDRGDELMRVVTPFVFRKYLDYDAYEGLRDVHRQIRAQASQRELAGNLKLGPGGIREVEFIVQALQLVRGGRDAGLRLRATLPAIDALKSRGLLSASAAAELAAAYTFLREVEHRLQYRDDAQTQDLPVADDERARLALACGHATPADFDAALGAHRDAVTAHFDALFGTSDTAESDRLAMAWTRTEPDDASASALRDAGYTDPATVIETLARARGSGRYLRLPARSRERFDALVPQLMRVAAATTEPQQTLERLLSLLEAIGGRSAYLALLIEHPPVLPRIAQLMSASAWAADYLTRHPILLDELLDSRVLLAEPSWPVWRNELAAMLAAHAGDDERQIDDLRHFQHAQTFRLLAQDLSGQLTVERLADHLSALADIVLEATLGCCWALTRGDAMDPPRFAIVGYGKLGGKELGYASDLDLVFLYNSEVDASGETAARYARLAQRINAWLTSATAAGRLYETDLRLRPDGASGLLVSSLDAFRHYQREQAWPWEHQALTRARFVAGHPDVGAAFEAEREQVLRLARSPTALAADVVRMRRKMADGHPNRSDRFDLKHDRGGMVDVEFCVQYLVLAHAHDKPSLVRNIGNIALLHEAATLGLLDQAIAAGAAMAYRDYRRLQHRLRLHGAREARADPAAHADARACVDALWQAVFAAPWEGTDLR